MGQKRRQYSREFKLDALKLVAEGRSVASVARGLGIHVNTLHGWRAQLANDPQSAFAERDTSREKDEARAEDAAEARGAGARHPEKSGGLLRKRRGLRFRFIHAHRSVFEVGLMCSTLRVSRSGYYAWRHRPQSPRDRANQELRSRIRAIHEGSGKTYGARRIVAELHDEGYRCSKKRVARLMRVEGLRAQWKKRFRVTTGSSHRLPTSPNVLDQSFDAERPDTRWVGDITYIPTFEGWLYLAVLIDLHPWWAGRRVRRSRNSWRSTRSAWRWGSARRPRASCTTPTAAASTPRTPTSACSAATASRAE